MHSRGAQACPLCSTLATKVESAIRRPLFACPGCDFRFVPASSHLSPELERDRYLLHQNNLSDTGYVKFLMEAVDCLKAHMKGDEARGSVLDYGSGPTPVLVELLRREGFQAVGIDPYFGAEDASGARFDAVVSTETVEHFRLPAIDWAKMIGRIRPGGLLVIVTSLVTVGVDFASWYYLNDPTHIAFYSDATFEYISRRWGLSLVDSNHRNRVVMRNTAPVPGPSASPRRPPVFRSRS